MYLKKSGHIDTMTSEYPSSLALPDGISEVCLTDLDERALNSDYSILRQSIL
jgi:hypothetical protein